MEQLVEKLEQLVEKLEQMVEKLEQMVEKLERCRRCLGLVEELEQKLGSGSARRQSVGLGRQWASSCLTYQTWQ